MGVVSPCVISLVITQAHVKPRSAPAVSIKLRSRSEVLINSPPEVIISKYCKFGGLLRSVTKRRLNPRDVLGKHFNYTGTPKCMGLNQ